MEVKDIVVTRYFEKKLIRFGIILFWVLFWLFNFIDKIIPGTEGFWIGKDRLGQFKSLFSSIGIENQIVAKTVLILISFAELLAFIFMAFALFALISGKRKWAHSFTFWGIVVSIFIFSLFSIGDQVFGESAELLEHSIFWMIVIVSWFMYIKTEEKAIIVNGKNHVKKRKRK